MPDDTKETGPMRKSMLALKVKVVKLTALFAALTVITIPAYATQGWYDTNHNKPRSLQQFTRDNAECSMHGDMAIAEGDPNGTLGWGAQMNWNIRAGQAKMAIYQECMIAKGYAWGELGVVAK
jgi:hypothetical protein